MRNESALVGVGVARAALAGGDGRGSLGGPVVGGVCQVRFRGGGSFLPAACWECGAGFWAKILLESGERSGEVEMVLLRDRGEGTSR